MSKHTPGPWAPSDETCNYVWSGDTCVARMAETDEKEANARLIAAAPELLEALRRVAMNGSVSQIISKADRDYMDAAIAKARGG